jgi:hypothetical protein
MCLILASVRVKEYGSDTEFLHADIMALLGGLFITATMLILSLLLIAEYKIRREAEIRDSSADKKESPKSIE